MNVQAEIVGGGPHDGANIQIPANCIAIVTIAEMSDNEYIASLAVRDGRRIVKRTLADCLAQLAESENLQ